MLSVLVVALVLTMVYVKDCKNGVCVGVGWGPCGCGGGGIFTTSIHCSPFSFKTVIRPIMLASYCSLLGEKIDS